MENTEEQTKRCTKCGLVKPLSEFGNKKSRLDGKKTQCKACDKSYQQKYYRENKEHILEVQSEYAKTHPERCNKSKRKYAEAHAEERRESRRTANLTPERKENKSRTARKVKISNPIHSMFLQTQSRAKHSNIPFTIKETDLVVPDICPVLGIPLRWTEKSRSGNTPSVDRMIPELGYVPGNVAIISWRANRLKNDGTAEELHRIADWMDSILNNPSS